MRKSSPRNAACSRTAVLALVLLVTVGCRHRLGEPVGTRGEAACRAIDSLLASALPERPWSMSGRAVFDVDQYRVRGRFVLDLGADGDFTLQFSGATLLGGHREDIVVLLSADTLRVFDRERGRFYEGEEVSRAIQDGTHVSGDWAGAVGQALGTTPCRDVVRAAPLEGGLAGELRTGVFRLDVSDGRLERAIWPDPVGSDTFRDRLEVHYHWSAGAVVELTAELPERGWRIRLERDSNAINDK